MINSYALTSVSFLGAMVDWGIEEWEWKKSLLYALMVADLLFSVVGLGVNQPSMTNIQWDRVCFQEGGVCVCVCVG